MLFENGLTDTYIKINSVSLNIPNNPTNKFTLLKCIMTKKAISD